ncbi:hypothetical protein KHS38_09550 [Mucilaginibacter sp. Bleaf8]|nr:hypothetical protein [Mucilaginibacter sp. Bleaf8]
MQNENYRALYFNAWENDFDNSPLTAIMGELKSLNPKDDDNSFRSLIQKGALISKNLVPLVIKTIVEKYIDVKEVSDIINNVTESAAEIFKDEIDEYAKKKQGLKDFRRALESFIRNNGEGKPIIFIVDELDRCRPSYAVEVLEQVKHFFNVPNIIFILSIDKVQLSNSIKGFYGSEQFDSTEYLKRFIDLEFRMPLPNRKAFLNYLFSYFEFDTFFKSQDRSQYREFTEDINLFLELSYTLFEKKGLTLRQEEKLFAHARLGLHSFKMNNYVFPCLYIFLIYLKDFNNDFYKKLQGRQHSPQEIITELESIYPTNIEEKHIYPYAIVEAQIALFYNNYYNEINSYKSQIIERESSSTVKYHLLINTRWDSYVLDYLTRFDRSNFTSLTIDYLLKKIDLLEAIEM